MAVHPMTDVGLVVVAAGSGTRFGRQRNKLFCEIRGRPLFCHCLATFAPLLRPESIVLVVSANSDAEFRKAIRDACLPEIRLVHGGATRQQSVWNGIQTLPAGIGIVAVHDAARPFATAELLAACVESAREHGSGIAARPVTDTIKIADPDGTVLSTPNRGTLRAAETPQVFRREVVEDGYRFVARNGLTATDDAQACELAGHTTFLVVHEIPNPKITYAHDVENCS